MKIGLILQARMTSQRLPAKMLRLVGGKPLLQHVYNRVKAVSGLSSIVIVTSRDPSDDLIVNYCNQNKIQVYRGDLHNVAGRFLSAINHYQFGAFVRVSGDSPLIDSHLIDQAITHFLESKYDIVSNVYERTFPRGQSVEVVKSDVFKQAYPFFQGDDYEHVTSYFYRNWNRFSAYSMKASENYSAINLCVDVEEDLRCFQKILKEVGSAEHLSWQRLVALYQKVNQSQQIAHEN